MTIEKRWLGDYKTPHIEIRAGEGGAKRVFGYGYVFNRYSQDLGGFVEQVAPGAGLKSLQEADIRGLVNHDANILLGRNKAGTMTLVEDNTGLAYEIDPPDNTTGRDWMVSLSRGDINQSSFSFRAIDVEWGLTPDERPLRTLKQFALYDVGPVTFPAYVDATSGARSLAAFADLAERRSVNLETVVELAQHGELRDLIKDGITVDPKPEQQREHITVTTDKAAEKRSEAREAAEARGIDPVPGSYEELSDKLEDAIEQWAKGYSAANVEGYAYVWTYVCVDATFADRVVATIYGSGCEDDGETFQFSYSIDNGAVTLGAPEAVNLTLTVVPGDTADPAGDMQMNSHDDSEKRNALSIARARLQLRAKALN